ncbi:hypothetical protein ACKU07_23405 [Enterobacter hormaechei]
MAEASRRTEKVDVYKEALAIRSNISLNLRPRKITVVSEKEKHFASGTKGFIEKK